MFKNFKKILATICSTALIVNFMSGCVFAEGHGNVMLLGNYQGGKTQIFRRYCDKPFDGTSAYLSTKAIHVILNLKATETGAPIATIRFYDTPGADKYYDAVVEMARICHVVIVVHDMMQEIDEVTGKKNIDYFKKLYHDLHLRMPVGSEIVFVGSKVDKKHEDIVVFSKNRRMLIDVAEALDCKLFLTSARTDEGLRELMEFIKTSFTTMTLPQKDMEDRFNVYELIPDPTLTGEISALREEKTRLESEKATITQEKTQALADKDFYKRKKEELEANIATLNSKISSLQSALTESKGKEKTGWDYIPIIGTFNFK